MAKKEPAQSPYHFAVGTRRIKQRLSALFRQPVFLYLTVWGHLSILAGTLSFYAFEHGRNPHVRDALDTLVWAVATVTTVGHAEIVPTTLGGKIVSIAMMIVGSLFLWSYTALFAGALVAPELKHLEDELRIEERSTKELTADVERLTEELRRRDGEGP